MDKRYMNSTEVCQLLGICKNTLHKLNNKGLTKAKRVIGGKHLYVTSEVHNFIEEQKVKGDNDNGNN